MKILKIALLSIFLLFTGCKVKKDIQLQHYKNDYQFKMDSAYLDSINSQIATIRAITINLDSNGKPSVININETVKEAKKEVKTGAVKKVEKASTDIKNENKKIDRTVGKLDISVIIFAIVVVIGIGIVYFKK
ncbi:hypothetical protein [Pedobacter steynii]